MKLRIISAIALVVIVIMTSVGVFIEKLDVNPIHQYASVNLMITSIVSNPQILHPKEQFSINGTIYNPNPYTINFDTNSISAKFDKNVITKHYLGCSNVIIARVIPPHQSVGFTLPYGCEAYLANSTGVVNATIVITFVRAGSVNTVITSKNFTINPPLNNRTGLTLEEQLGLSNTKINLPTKTTIFDTGIHPFSINVENTNFTLNYDISGNNKLLDANMDLPTKSLVLSIYTSNNGILSISIPRALLDSKNKSGADDIWSVIMDAKEIEYTEKKTDNSRILSFSFDDNTKKIVIIPYCSSFPC